LGWFGSSITKSVGIDIGTSYLKMVEVERRGVVPQITNFIIKKVDEGLIHRGKIENFDSLATFIDEVLRFGNFSRERVVLCIGGDSCSIQIEEFAAKDERELASSVSFWHKEKIGSSTIPFAHQILAKDVDDIGGNI